jgi:MOSC domain-containing protein YiiM
MNKVGNVSLLFYSPPSGRTSVTSFALNRKGIVDDKHYNKNAERSVLIATLESYALSKYHHIDIAYGLLGENILIDYNPYHLKAGQKVQIGEVILEISQPCTLCKSLSTIDKKLPKLLKNDRGIFAMVLKSGHIKEGDTFYLLDEGI